MRQTIKRFKLEFILGVNTAVGRLTDPSIDQFNRVEQISTLHLLREYFPFVRARGRISIKSSSACNRRYELPAYWLTATSRWE